MRTIHFDFTVNEADAENIFDAIQSKMITSMEYRMDLVAKQATLTEEGQKELAMWNRDIAYWRELKKKMLFTREEIGEE